MTNFRVSGSFSLILLTVSLGLAQQPPRRAAGAMVCGMRSSPRNAPNWISLRTGDMTAFANFLADDAVFVDAAGAAGKAEVVRNALGFRLHENTMTDVRFVGLSVDSGLIAYRIEESGTSHGKEFAAKVNVSALWRRRGGKWMCVFSQETAAK